MFLVACACRVSIPHRISATQIQGWINLYHHPLELHLSKPNSVQNDDVLVVYATGDGGWHGLDEQIFEWISTWDYPVVGFSSRDYLKNLGYVGDTTTPRRLVQDFETIIRFAEGKLDMQPSTRIILVGLSRGAGLAVVAAGQGELNSNLGGLIAVALTKEEEHVVHYRDARRSPPNQPKRELLQIQTYEYLPRIAAVPVVVIQSTHDDYLSASAARKLFGPDTELKKLLAINAKNHRFTDGYPDLYKEAETALSWIYKTGQPRENSR
jgi:fermentation-respiration switch protein FrsA (DUF1100 family)